MEKCQLSTQRSDLRIRPISQSNLKFLKKYKDTQVKVWRQCVVFFFFFLPLAGSSSLSFISEIGVFLRDNISIDHFLASAEDAATHVFYLQNCCA